MSDHAVVGPHRESLEVPRADHRSPMRLRLGESAVLPEVLREPRQLRRGRDVGEEHAARRQGVGRSFEVLPRREHVEDDAVNAVRLELSDAIREVANLQRPRGVRAAKVGLDVGARDVRKVLAALDGDEFAAVANGAQQRHREGPGANPRLHHARAREDVGHLDDLTRVLGVDHGSAARHGHDEVAQQRPQHE